MSFQVVRWLMVFSMLSLAFAGCLDRAPFLDEANNAAGDSVPVAIDDPELSLSGQWLPTFDGEVPAINMALMNDGRILYWSGVEVNPEDGDTDVVAFGAYPTNGESRILDLSGDEPVIITPTNEFGGGLDLFCSGHTILQDGRIISAGGTEWGSTLDPNQPNLVSGIQDARVFDPETNEWTRISDLLIPRWYPSLFLDEAGNAISAGGIQHWERPDEHWSSWEVYNESADQWNGIAGTESEQVLPLYPRTYQVAGGPLRGQYFSDTAGALWAPFGEHPLQAMWNLQWAFDRETGTWTNLGQSQYGVRSYPGHVMLQLDPARDYAPEFFMFGGTLQQSGAGVAFAERTDLSTNPPTRIDVPDMAVARWHPFGVVLPDGDVLNLGGAQFDNVLFLGTPDDGATLEVEMYNPASNSWRDVADMTVHRTYHSTAMLLPDARVLVGGHVPDPMIVKAWRDNVHDQIVEKRFEIYEPGYLFRGERPVITAAPADIDYDSAFEVMVDAPADLHGFVLVHPGATTHSYDGSIRHIQLDVVADMDGVVTLATPPDGVVAPPGDYMLFALSEHADGPVPSEAVWLHLD